MSWPKHDNGHARERHQRARHIPGRRPNTFNSPEPEYRYKNIDPSVRGIGPAGSGRMEREQPCKQCKAASGRHKKPYALALFEPEIRQVAPNDFRNCRRQEKNKSLQLKHFQ